MRKGIIKAAIIGLALFFTYTYCYQHLAQASTHAVQTTLPNEKVTGLHAASNSDQMAASDQTQVYWKNTSASSEGVVPKITQGVGSVAGAVIHQGVVVVASLVYGVMSLFF